jgi:hypothetical protein
MAQKEKNLGEMIRDPHEDSIIDHKWLEAQPGVNYDNIPSNFEHQIVPQLAEQWGNAQNASPFYLIPNQATNQGTDVDPTVRQVGPGDLTEVVMVAKKAMMSGMAGPEVLAHLRERFPEETLKTASAELTKVASEEGLLGNVYIDLSAYNSTREAVHQLGHHKVRLASFAVGAPMREKDFVDSFGRCRNLAKTVVASVDYSPRVLSHYETHLKNMGAISKTASITNKEELRQAFISARTKRAESLVNTDEQLTGKTDAPDIVASMQAVTEESLTQNAKTAAQLRIAQARPIIAKIQNMMLKGITGDSLKTNIRTACDSETISSLKMEIAKIANLQGLIGPLFVDISAYPDVKTASAAVNSSYMKPRYLIASMPVPMGFMDKVSTQVGIPEFKKESSVTIKDAHDIILALQGAGKIDDQTSCDLMDKAKSGEQTPIQVIRTAALHKASDAHTETRIAASNDTFLSGGESVRNSVDRTTIKKAALESIERGVSITSVQSKIASFVPIGEAIGIIRDTLSSMTKVSAEVLDSCQSEKYPLLRTASLICAHKCNGCVFHHGNGCSRQGLSFEGKKMASASESVPSVHIAQEFGIQSNSIIVDLSNVVIPAKTASVDPYLGSRATVGNISF